MSMPDLDPRFDDLVRELRAAKPQPPAALAARVARLAEEPAAPPASRWRRRPVFVLAAAAALVVAGVGAGLVLGGGTSSHNVAAGKTQNELSAQQLAVPAVKPKAAAQAKVFSPAATNGAAAHAPARTLPPAPYRATEEHASFTLAVKDGAALDRATRQAMQIVRGLGGYVVTASSGGGDSTLQVKVPIGHVQQAIAKLTGLGTVLAQHIDLRDLQAPINAQQTRAAALSAAIAQLRHELDTESLTVDARARLEAELAVDRARLAAAESASANLAKRARLATIALRLTTRHTAQPVAPSHPGQARRTLVHAWHLLGRELAFVLAGALLVAPLALLAALVYVTRRQVRRRQTARLLAAS
jgi:hypothetical protein